MEHGEISKQLAKSLLDLQSRIADAQIPPSKLDESINLATWNIRDFGKSARRPESLHYIAEIIGQFDLVAIIELRDNLSELAQVLKYAGPYYKAVYSDYIVDAGGNRERIAYVYDKRAVVFNGLASCTEPPRKKVKGEYLPEISWWRKPYMASFRAGSFDFVVLSAHIRWGESAKSRIPELQMLADWVDSRLKEKGMVDKDIFVMGDFNIPEIDDELFKAVTSKGLMMPDSLRGVKGSDLAKQKRYDQILHLPLYPESFTGTGGVLDFYEGDWSRLFPDYKATSKQYTFQLSDHLPLWIHINTNTEGLKLAQLISG